MARLTSYKPEYCELLIAHMAKGFSFEAFAADVHTDRATLYRWLEQFSEFCDAKKEGESKNRKFWENIGILGTLGKIKGFNVGSWVFMMKNMHRWTDGIKITHENLDQVLPITGRVPTKKELLEAIDGDPFIMIEEKRANGKLPPEEPLDPI